MTLGSLFDGIGGFPLAGVRHGIQTLWTSDIEESCEAVTKHHFPDALQVGDITKLDGSKLPPVDIITFGFPCQDLSVAGKRDGLHGGERSVLFFEAMRLIDEMLCATNREYPKVILFENVPGLLSSNDGKDFRKVLDTMQDSGFVIDINLYDAQFMGVPQRRRRLFGLGWNIDILLSRKTLFSWSITAKFLVEILLNILDGLQQESSAEPDGLGCSKRVESVSRQKRMKLFKVEERSQFLKLLNYWDETSLLFTGEPDGLDAEISKLREKQGQTVQVTLFDAEIPTTSNLSIDESWKNILDALYDRERSFTTSTPTEQTTALITSAFVILENILKRIILSKDWCRNLSEVTSLFSTLIERNTDCEGQATGKGAGELGRFPCYGGGIGQLSAYRKFLVRDTGAEPSAEVQPVEKSLRGDTQTGGTAGEGAAEDAERSAGGSVLFEPMSALEENWAESSVKNALRAGASKSSHAVCSFMGGQGSRARSIAWTEDATPPLKAVPSGSNTVPTIVFKERAGCPGEGKGILCGDKPFTLSTLTDQAVCYAIDQQGGKGGANYSEDVTPPLMSDSHGTPHGVCYPINTMVATRWNADDGRTTFGVGDDGDPQFTIGAAHEHAVCYALEGNGARPSHQEPGYSDSDKSYTLNTIERHGVCYPIDSHQQDSRFKVCADGIAPTLPGQMGTGGNNGPMVLEVEPVVYAGVGVTSKLNVQNPQPGDPCPTLHNDSRNYLVGPVVECYGGNGVAQTLDASYWKGAGARNGKEREFVAVAGRPPRRYIIRRLSPTECERLQGFPDGWTDIEHKGRPMADSARYRMLGNSVAVPCVEYIMGRIDGLVAVQAQIGGDCSENGNREVEE